MKFRARILEADFEKDTLTLSLPRLFWHNHSVKTGEVEIETSSIEPLDCEKKKENK